MPTLFSYCVRTDDGAAPNPFGGVCTLAICKPRIRLTARVGDWIAGHGSAQSRIGDTRTRLIYAMRVTRILSMQEYDEFSRLELRDKIPQPDSPELWRRAGDSIYDFSSGKSPVQRPGVHQQEHMAHDLSGANVLLSTDFYYFGDHAIPIPAHLQGIIHQRGHKSLANAPLVAPFERWIRSLGVQKNSVLGIPIDVAILERMEPSSCAPSPRSPRRRVLSTRC